VSDIRKLNDRFRRTFIGGHVTVTDGVAALPRSTQAAIKKLVRTLSRFDDPHGDHDFGTFDVAGNRVFWRIEHYDRTFKKGSPDPASSRKTIRVLTIGLMSEEGKR
jgi:Protein of unknown function (DUF3768)